MRTYRKPDGTFTGSAKKYCDAWNALKKPLEDRLGLFSIGFDPGFLMADKESNAPVDIPVWLAKRIVENLK
jgi:hypothetical protein